MKRTLALLLSVVMAIGLLAACGGDASSASTPAGSTAASTPADTSTPAAPAGDKTLIVRASGDPVTLNPNGSSDDAAFNIVSNVYSQLVRLDTTRQIIPDLATSWETSEDGLTMTFHLVDNATFHDGEPLTAEDVAYTFNYILTNETCLMYARFSPQIASVEAVDDTTVQFNLINPYSALIGYLGYYATYILPQHIFDNGEPWEENAAAMNPIGSGPFKFVEHNPGESVVLEKNENYFRADVNIDKLIFKQIPDADTAVQALMSGELDYMSAIPDAHVDALMADPAFEMNLSVLPSPTYAFFNFDHADVLTKDVRLAIAHAINRDEVSQKVFNGNRPPEYNFYPTIIEWASNSDAPAPEYSVEKAVQVLEDAGYQKDADGFYVRGLTLDVFSTDSNPDVGKLVVGACAEAGIEIELIVSEYQAWLTKVRDDGDFMIAIQGGFQGPDPSALWGRIGTGGASNYGHYSNAEIDALFDEGMMSADESVRQPFYYEIQEIMAEELPIIPIVQYATYVAQGSNIVDTPLQCAGRAGWIEFCYTDIQ